MKAITTKYHGATNTRGSRITASDEDGNRVSIPYPHELSGEAVHRKAAEALCAKMMWAGRLVGDSVKNGYVFVWADGPSVENYTQVLTDLSEARRQKYDLLAALEAIANPLHLPVSLTQEELRIQHQRIARAAIAAAKGT